MRYVVAVSLALIVSGSSAVAQGPEPRDRIVRIGFVDPQPLSNEGNVHAFWSRLRELGWVNSLLSMRSP